MSVTDKRTVSEIQTWMCGRIADRLGIDSAEIDPTEPFVSYGIGSLDTLTLVGELEDWLGRPLKTTLLFDYPTVRSLAEDLANEGQA